MSGELFHYSNYGKDLAEPMIAFYDNKQFCDVILISGVDKKKYI